MSIFLQLAPYLFSCLNNLGVRNLSLKILSIITAGENFYFEDEIYDFESQKLVPRLLLLLPGKGCEWAEKSGGCTMCGFPAKTKKIGKYLSGSDLVSLTKIALLMSRRHKPKKVMVYNGGSFLNQREISQKAQKKILALFYKHETIKEIFIESRAEYIIDKNIQFLKEIAQKVKVVVGIGLEAQDDKVRNEYIKKGLTKKEYERAVNILKGNKMYSLTYVLIKPIYLEEKEAIEEAVKTVEYAFSVGSDEVALESSFIQEGTEMEKLYEKGEYTPPLLWSIIEVIKRTKDLGHVMVGGFSDEPPPIAIPKNCKKCSAEVLEGIERYRKTFNLKHFEVLNCGCRDNFLK